MTDYTSSSLKGTVVHQLKENLPEPISICSKKVKVFDALLKALMTKLYSHYLACCAISGSAQKNKDSSGTKFSFLSTWAVHSVVFD